MVSGKPRSASLRTLCIRRTFQNMIGKGTITLKDLVRYDSDPPWDVPQSWDTPEETPEVADAFLELLLTAEIGRSGVWVGRVEVFWAFRISHSSSHEGYSVKSTLRVKNEVKQKTHILIWRHKLILLEINYFNLHINFSSLIAIALFYARTHLLCSCEI